MSDAKMLPMREKWVGYRKPDRSLIPADWTVARIREVASFKAGGSFGLTMSDYVTEGTPAYTAEGQNGFAPIEEFDTKAVIVSSIGALCGKSFYAEGPFTTLANIQVIFGDEEKVSNYFLWSLLNDRAYWAPYQTAQPFIRPSDIQKSWIPVPATREEQTRIAETLKAADDQIRAIEDQLRKAQRVKDALLQSLFLEGRPGSSYPKNQTKIGQIPSHWEFQRIGKTFRETPFNGISPASRPNPPGTPILNVSCIKNGVCATELVTYVDVDEAAIRANSAERGDFFVLRGNGNRNYVGTGGWLRVDPPDNCIFSDKLIRLRFDTSRVVDGFYPYLWQSRAFQIRLQSKAQSSSGLWMMNKRDISREWVALPPKNEQSEIVEILDAATDNHLALAKKLATARRLKQSLLQNLLTGKIRLKD